MVKIGSSKNPKKRLREFNILHPTREYEFYDLRFFTSGYHEAENIMHTLLRDYRLRGEWFELTPDKAAAVLKRLHTQGVPYEKPNG